MGHTKQSARFGPQIVKTHFCSLRMKILIIATKQLVYLPAIQIGLPFPASLFHFPLLVLKQGLYKA
jgi:hypothetical protein